MNAPFSIAPLVLTLLLAGPSAPADTVAAGPGQTLAAGPGTRVNAGPGLRQGLWHGFTPLDGLPGHSIRAIVQAPQGHLWMATNNGLCRYDGQTFVSYTSADGLPHNNILSLLIDHQGTLWIGTAGGLSRYNGTSFTNFTSEDGLPGNQISTLCEDRDGRLWLGVFTNTDTVQGRGVSRYAGTSFTNFTSADGLASDQVNRIFQDRDGTLWFATTQGVSRFSGSSMTPFVDPEKRLTQAILAIAQDGQGHMWFSTDNGGVVYFDGQSFGHLSLKTNFRFPSIMFDRSGQLWIGSGGGRGIWQYNGQSLTHFTTENGLTDQHIACFLEDRDGQLWVGTRYGGLMRYDGRRVQHFTRLPDGALIQYVFAIGEDPQQRLLIGGNFDPVNLARFDGRQFVPYVHPDSTAHQLPRIGDFEIDPRHNLWLGLRFGGLAYYDGRQVTRFALEELDGRGNQILLDRKGHLWIAGQGLSRYDGQHFTHFSFAEGILSLFEDRDGLIWVGTRNGGVYTYANDTLSPFSAGLGDMGVSAIYQDREGRHWFGTEKGIFRYDGNTLTQISATIWVFSILQDRDDRMWFAAFGKGITVYDGQVFQTLNSRNFLLDDGVQEIYQDRHGDIWIGSDGGAVRYRPSHTPPRAHILLITADQNYSPTQPVSLPSSQDFVALTLGASSLTHFDGFVYRYRLKGYDDTWHNTREAHIEYLDLPRGRYTFELVAVDRDLNYSEPVAVELTIHLPYERIGLWSGLGLALLCVGVVSRQTVRRRRERDRARAALVEELEAELQRARDLQLGLMPKQAPTLHGLEVSGLCWPATQVGGDFFQYFPTPTADGLTLVLADATGHAMEAALPVVLFDGVLESQMSQEADLAARVKQLNRLLHRLLERRTLVCMTMAEVDGATGRLRLVNAGNPYPFHYRAVEGRVVEIESSGYPLGAWSTGDYGVKERLLEAGDRVVLCSDGLVEARNAEGVVLGFERLAAVIAQGCAEDLAADALVARVVERVAAFTGSIEQADDQTVVVVAFTP